MQKILLYIFAFSTLLFLSNCKMTKTIKVNKFYEKYATKTQTGYFREQIPFKLQGHTIIVPVKIENQIYDFLLDTGSSCVISPELANKFKLQGLVNNDVKDANGTAKKMAYTTIPKMTIGGIDFFSNLAVVTNVGNIGCRKIYGFIGANLMQSAIWQIDYQNQKLLITNYRDSLDLGTVKNIDFQLFPDGQIYFDAYFTPRQKIRTLFDTGSYGDFSIPERTRNFMMPSNAKYLKSYGLSQSINSIRIDTSRHALAPYLRFDGGWILQNNPVTFRQSRRGATLMGYRFLKDYVVTLDWGYQKVSFRQVAQPKKKVENTFGFYCRYAEGKVIISNVFENSPASEANLHVSEQILMMNGKDLSHTSEEEYCNTHSVWDSENKDEVTITVKQKDGEKTLTLKKVNLDF